MISVDSTSRDLYVSFSCLLESLSSESRSRRGLVFTTGPDPGTQFYYVFFTDHIQGSHNKFLYISNLDSIGCQLCDRDSFLSSDRTSLR